LKSKKQKTDIKNDEKNNGKKRKHEDELEVFEERAKWFSQIHGDRQGYTVSDGRTKAIDQLSLIGKTNRLENLDPGGSTPKQGFELISGKTNKKSTNVKVEKAKNPKPNSSFGFAAQAVRVSGNENSLVGVTLKIRNEKELSDELIHSTIRIFRFDETSKEWHLMPRSGSSLDGTYAWARGIHSGLYVPIGLPRNPWMLQTVLTIDSYSPWIRAARQRDSTRQILDPICRLILCDGIFREAQKNPKVADELGLPPIDTGGINDICDRCLGLDLPSGGLPESSILEDPGLIAKLASIIIWPWPFFCRRWTSAGPANFSGRIKSLGIHPTSANILYAGGADGGVWKSIDGGITWYSKMQLELSMAISAIAISTSSPDVIYAATGEDVPGWGPSYPGVGVYKTLDGGSDWDLLAPIASNRCTRVLVHPSDPNIVYVAGNAGLHKSIDGGNTWSNVRTDHVSDALIDPLTANTIYAAVWNSGVYKSNDAGVTWNLLSNGLPTGSAADWIKIAMGLNGVDGTAFLVAKMGTDSGMMFKSNDAGVSWTSIPGTHQPATYNEWTNMVAVHPSNQNILFAGGVGIERSTNGGTTFSNIGGTHSDHHVIVFSVTSSNVCYMATDGGVYKSTDSGATWSLSSQGLISTQLYSIGVAQTSPFVMGGGTQDQGIIKTDGSINWTDTNSGNEGGFFVVDPNNSNNIYVTPWSTNLRRSTNGGTSWTTILNGLGTPPVGVSHLAVKFGDSTLLLCSGGTQVFRSTNQGSNWTSVLSASGSTTYVAFSPSNPQICYAATSSGRIYRSAGNGASGTWSEPYSSANKPPTGYITGIAISWNDPNLLYISYGGYGISHILRSADGGMHWFNANGVLPTDSIPNTPVSAIVVNQYNSEILYAATDIGVFRTRDGGDSWEPFDDGMPRIVTSGISLHRNTNSLYISTMGRGAYRRVL
jgi:hypothetical protein